MVGSGFDRQDLDRAGAPGAGALAAVTSGDNSNILTARIARENSPASPTSWRGSTIRPCAEIYQRLGIPTVATVTWTIDQVTRKLLPEAAVGEWTDATGRLVLVEHRAPRLVGGEGAARLGMRGKVTVVAVTRAGMPRLDIGELVGQEGDVLHLAVMQSSLVDLEDLLAHRPLRSAAADGGHR